MSEGGDSDWPLLFPDLTAYDFFSCGYLKERVYANKSTTVHMLKANIVKHIGTTSVETCQNVLKNLVEALTPQSAAATWPIFYFILHGNVKTKQKSYIM